MCIINASHSLFSFQTTSEWVVEDCDNTWSESNDDDEFALPGWSIPTADSALAVVWLLCCYLFGLGSKDEAREVEAMREIARERRRPLLS